MVGFLIFVLLTFFFVTKLNEILGMRVGFHIKKENLQQEFLKADIQETTISETDKKLMTVNASYPGFNAADFLNKAQKAFELIFTAYAAGDMATLKELLAPRTFQAFSMAISDRKKCKETLEGILVRFVSVEILDSDVNENDILITVKFVTEQSNVLKSAEGQILEGNADFVETRTDVWSFSRKKSATDSRWYLYEIKSEA